MIVYLVCYCCLLFVAFAQDEQMRVQITTDLLRLDKSPILKSVRWRERRSSQLYCIGSDQIKALRFECPTCDIITQKTLSDNTKVMTEFAGYPAIKLNEMTLNTDHWKNGHRLRCVGFYDGSHSDSTLNVTADVLVDVIYMEKPVILTENDHYPIVETGANRFYVGEVPLRLVCSVDSNPEPDEFQWLSGKTVRGETKSFLVSREFIGETIHCKAKIRETNTEMESGLVLIDDLKGPNSVRSNFQSLLSENLIHPQTNAIPLGSTIELQCSVSGLPKPKIKWFHKNAHGNFNAAQCEQSSTLNEEKESNNINWLVTSHCNLHLNNFDYFGQYWCSGCIEYAQNLSMCTTSLQKLPTVDEFLTLNVTGAPKMSDNFQPRVEQSINLDRITIYVPFCANPMPVDSDIYWLINDEKLSIGEQLSNIIAQPTKKNISHPLCYELPLVFKTPENSDKRKTYQLFLSNSEGQMNQILNIGQFIVGNDTEDVSSSSYIPASSYDPLALGIGVAVVIFLIIALCLCAYLWFNSKACFSFRNSKGKSAKYQSNLPTHVTPATENGSEKHTNGIENEPQVTEALNLNGHKVREDQTYIKSYDDFDLIKETDHILRPSSTSEREKMLPKTNERKIPTDSAV